MMEHPLKSAFTVVEAKDMAVFRHLSKNCSVFREMT